MRYSDYKCFRFGFDSGVAFVSIDHPPINLLDEVLSQEFDKLGRELEADESVRVVVLQSALPDFFIAHSGLGRVGNASKIVSHTRSFRLTQTIGERFRNMPKVTIAKIEGRARGGGSEIALAMDMCFAAIGKAIFGHPEVAIGLVPGGGATQRWPRLMGRGRAFPAVRHAKLTIVSHFSPMKMSDVYIGAAIAKGLIIGPQLKISLCGVTGRNFGAKGPIRGLRALERLQVPIQTGSPRSPVV